MSLSCAAWFPISVYCPMQYCSRAALPEAKLIVDARCTASNDDGMNEKALDILQGVQVEVQGR